MGKVQAKKDGRQERQENRGGNGERAEVRQEKVQEKKDGRQERQENRGGNGERAEARKEKVQAKKADKAAAKQISKSMRSFSLPRPTGQRRNKRKQLILSRQDIRQDNKADRLQNKAGQRVEARKEVVQLKKSERAENVADRKEDRNEERIAAIKGRKEAREERGPRPDGSRRESRLEKLQAIKDKYVQNRRDRMKTIQLAKTWKPCDENGNVSNMPWGDRKRGHMQVCMGDKGYQYDAMRCIIYGMRAEHVDDQCRQQCDDILASYTDLNVDMASCAASKQ